MIDAVLGIGFFGLLVRKHATLHHLCVDVWVALLPLRGQSVKVLGKGLPAVLVKRVEPHAITRAELQREADAHIIIGHKDGFDFIHEM
jgi:hypothetical protein